MSQHEVVLASLTIATIDKHLEEDQGAAFRQLLKKHLPLCEDGYRGEEDAFRSHLGASILGRKCDRELYYGFHWTTDKKFPGRILRLFNRGHLEEPRLVSLLEMIGCKIWQYDQEGNQFRITGHNGHYGGSLDTVVCGIPEMPDEVMLAEYKTHSNKSFCAVQANGVRQSKIEHFVQMQQYMGTYGFNWGLYLAVNKDNDEIYGELIRFDLETHDNFRTRAGAIIHAEKPPERISTSPGWYECKFCDHRPVCHLNAPPARNCRTCINSRPCDLGSDGEWLCSIKAGTLSKREQLDGCEYYQVDPELNLKQEKGE